jgi:hypothetical protein
VDILVCCSSVRKRLRRHVIVNIATSADGYISRPDGGAKSAGESTRILINGASLNENSRLDDAMGYRSCAMEGSRNNSVLHFK